MLNLVEHEKSYKTPGPAQSLYVYVYAQSDLSLSIAHGKFLEVLHLVLAIYAVYYIWASTLERGLSLVEAHIIRKVYLT